MIYVSGQGLTVHSMKESQTRVKKKAEETEVHETTKAAAWAVFQHRNGGGSNSHRHHGVVLVQQATRFKIEAQMKNELERRFVVKEALPSWDASSTLFDKYELDSVFKYLEFAFQSADTQQKVSYDGTEYYDESASAYSFRDNHYPGAHAQHPQQISHADLRSRHGYGNSEEERPNQQNWLEAVNESQRFRGNYLETVDESLPLANVQKTEHEQDVNGYEHEESPKPKLVMNMTMYDDICKQAIAEVVPQWKVFKTVQFLHTPNRWNLLQGRYSFDTSPKDVQKDSKQSRKAKLLNMFKSTLAKDSTTTPKSTRQARIVPDDSSQKGRRVQLQDPLNKSGELVKNKVGADTKDSDIANGDGYEALGYPLNTKGVHQDQVALPLDLKSGLHTVLVPNLSGTVRLSTDMRNLNVEEGLHNHLSHGDLKQGPAASPGSPGGRRKKTYSLNAAVSPVRTTRRSMLSGSREDLDSDDEEEYQLEYHHHYHHHHHHIANHDYELTVQDIVKRASRKSFEEMAHRFSNSGSKAPRNSFENPFLSMPARASTLLL